MMGKTCRKITSTQNKVVAEVLMECVVRKSAVGFSFQDRELVSNIATSYH